jgi:predicted HAD superfamily hydrolase
MCKNYCLITAEENFNVGQTLTKGRIGIHPSVESIYKKIPQNGMSSINKYKLMEIDVEKSKLKKGNTSLILEPNSKAKVIGIVDMS